MMSKPWAFLESSTQYLTRPRLGNKKHPTLWPSQATAVVVNEWGEEEVKGACRRKTFFRYVKDSYKFYDKYSFWEPLIKEITLLEKPADKYMRWIWVAGELYEEHLIEMAKVQGLFIAEQVPVYVPEYNISGKIDIVVLNPVTGKFSIVEAKSVYGFGGNVVLGTEAHRRKGGVGEPRDSNLMQLAQYQWWFANERDDFEVGRLAYGSRDTGRYAEYEVDVFNEDNVDKIRWRGICPNVTEWVISDITIDNILEQYRYIDTCVESGEIPKRDFELSYSEERILKLNERGLLSKKDSEQIEKRAARELENQERIAEGKKPKAQLKPVEKGDWQCRLCSYSDICYNKNGEPRDL